MAGKAIEQVPAAVAEPTAPPAAAGKERRHREMVRIECVKAALELRSAATAPRTVVINAQVFEEYVVGEAVSGKP